jgi:hypothetical protein
VRVGCSHRTTGSRGGRQLRFDYLPDRHRWSGPASPRSSIPFRTPSSPRKKSRDCCSIKESKSAWLRVVGVTTISWICLCAAAKAREQKRGVAEFAD